MNLMKLVCWRDSDLGPQKEDFVGLETKTLDVFWHIFFGYIFWYTFCLGGLCAQFIRHQKYMDQKRFIDISFPDKKQCNGHC